MEAVDTLIFARWIIPVEPAGQVLEHCALAIRQGRIHAIVPQSLAASRFDATEVVDRRSHVLVPGFVNAHAQTPLTLWRGAGTVPSFENWADAELVQLGAELAAAEMIASGTTCVLDSFGHPEIRARALADARLRACVSLPIADGASAWTLSADEAFSHALEIHDEYRSHPLITTAFAPAGVDLADATLERIGRLANELEMPIVLPLHEKAAGLEADSEGRGERPLARLERLGLLSPLTVGVHMVHLTAEDLDAAQRAAINVVHCPQSNLKRGGGLANVAKLQAYGLNVACGTDSPVDNDDLDMLDELRTAALLSRGRDAEEFIDAHEWLRIGTMNGAQALGLAEICGSLEPGKWADICAIDLNHPATQPVHDPAEVVVYAASRAQVSDVWVAGRALLSEGRLTGIDTGNLIARVERWRASLGHPERENLVELR
jgi:5-methylthioadenosine/S-adenosylhomocysteine deaminase